MKETIITVNMYKPEGGYVDTPSLERCSNCSVVIVKEPGERVKMTAKVYVTSMPVGGEVLVPLLQPTVSMFLDNGWLCAAPTKSLVDGDRLDPDYVAAIIERNIFAHNDDWYNSALQELLVS